MGTMSFHHEFSINLAFTEKQEPYVEILYLAQSSAAGASLCLLIHSHSESVSGDWTKQFIAYFNVNILFQSLLTNPFLAYFDRILYLRSRAILSLLKSWLQALHFQ
jgi:hypothetical protein